MFFAPAGGLFAEAPDPSVLAGGGWAGAGLLGLVLAWLLFKHLPDKARELKEYMSDKDKAIAQIVDKFDARLEKFDSRIESQQRLYQAALKEVVDHCAREMIEAKKFNADLVAEIRNLRERNDEQHEETRRHVDDRGEKG